MCVQFDRSHRGKSDSLCGLEEVLCSMTPSVFVDDQLSKHKASAISNVHDKKKKMRKGVKRAAERRSQHTLYETRARETCHALSIIQLVSLFNGISLMAVEDYFTFLTFSWKVV